MLASEIPARIPLPFADSGTKNAIPTASQIGITPGAASLTDGFPPLTFTPIASGGIPPAGADFNGILNMITAVQQWQSAGGIFKYDATFSTAIGGYPAGAVLLGSDNETQWLNLADNNTTDPESSPADWAVLSSYGITAVTGLTNTNVTLTPAQYSKSIITLAGTLTGNIQIIFPVTMQKCLVINNTTGAFTVTCKTASGTGRTVPQDGIQEFVGDGTNLLPLRGGGLAAWTSQGFNPTGAGQTKVNTLTFTAPCAGKIIAYAICNASNPLANAVTNVVAINGTNYSTDTTVLTLINPGVRSVAAGSSNTITQTVTSSGSASTINCILSYMFIPS